MLVMSLLVSLFVCLFVYSFVCLFVCLFFGLFVCLCGCVCRMSDCLQYNAFHKTLPSDLLDLSITSGEAGLCERTH